MKPHKIYYIKLNNQQLHDFEFESYSEAEELAKTYRIENAISEDIALEIWHACIKWDGEERFYGCEGRVSTV